MLDLVEGGLTLIADEPAPGLSYSGMAKWSYDGSRILFHAGTGPDWPRARIWASEIRDGAFADPARREKMEGTWTVVRGGKEPAGAKLVEIVGKRTADRDVSPRWPVFRPGTRQCFFEGVEGEKRTIYSVQRGESLRA